MLPVLRKLVVFATLGALAGCGGGSGSPAGPGAPLPTPVPTPTPEPAGVISLTGSSLAAGSTVAVSPMGANGQQAQQLWFRASITLKQSLSGALVRAWVRTEDRRCMGGGRAWVDFRAGVETPVTPASMSHPGDASLCTLPFTTTQVEVEVLSTVDQILTQRFPMVYHFVAAP